MTSLPLSLTLLSLSLFLSFFLLSFSFSFSLSSSLPLSICWIVCHISCSPATLKWPPQGNVILCVCVHTHTHAYTKCLCAVLARIVFCNFNQMTLPTPVIAFPSCVFKIHSHVTLCNLMWSVWFAPECKLITEDMHSCVCRALWRTRGERYCTREKWGLHRRWWQLQVSLGRPSSRYFYFVWPVWFPREITRTVAQLISEARTGLEHAGKCPDAMLNCQRLWLQLERPASCNRGARRFSTSAGLRLFIPMGESGLRCTADPQKESKWHFSKSLINRKWT